RLKIAPNEFFYRFPQKKFRRDLFVDWPLFPQGRDFRGGAGAMRRAARLPGPGAGLAQSAGPERHDRLPAAGALRIYTADKVLIGEFGEERRNVLRFNEIPDVMKSAILSAEDDRFYQHGGIDWTGVARAVVANLTHMSKTQGASTITMQVA